MCARVFVSVIVVQRKQQPPGTKKKASTLTSFTLEGKEQANNGAGKAAQGSRLVQEANERREAERGMEAVHR